jgi:hypothetical protein
MKPFKRTLVAGAILGLIGAVAGCSPAEEAKQQEPKPEAQVEEQAQATATAEAVKRSIWLIPSSRWMKTNLV